MMRWYWQFLLICGFTWKVIGACYAQAESKDIEIQYRETLALPDDTSKVRLLNKLTYEFLNADQLERADQCAAYTLQLAERLNDIKGIALEYYAMGMIDTRRYDFPKAINSFREALSAATRLGNKKLASNAYLCIGNSNFSLGKYDEAIEAHNKALPIKQELRDTPLIIMTYNNIGIVHWNAGNYAEAYKNYGLGLELGKASGDSFNIAHSQNTLGLVYDNEGNYPEALKYFLMAIESSTANRDTGLLIGVCNNVGNLYRKQEKFDLALDYFNRAIAWNERIMDSRELGNSHNYMGSVYRLKGQFSDARDHIQQAIEIFTSIDFRFGIAESHSNLGAVLYEYAMQEKNNTERDKLLQESKQHVEKALSGYRAITQNEGEAECQIRLGLIYMAWNQPVKARQYLTNGLSVAKSAGVKEKIRDGYLAMGKLDSMTGNWKDAYYHLRMFAIYRDSMLNEDISRKVLALQMQHDFDHREDSLQYEMKSLQQEGEIQALQIKRQRAFRNYTFLGFGVLCVLAYLLYSNYVVRQRLKLQTMRNKIASDLHDDVGSTLSSISIFSEMAQEQSKDALPLLNTITESSRNMLDAMADIVWTINPDNDQFEKILMRMRNFAFELLGAKKIEFEFNADNEMAEMKMPMDVRKNLYLIFKEATNNMAKYSGASRAQFSIRHERDKIMMNIRDNGNGFDPGQVTLGNGIKSMQKRAADMGGTLEIDSQPGKGTSILLRVAV